MTKTLTGLFGLLLVCASACANTAGARQADDANGAAQGTAIATANGADGGAAPTAATTTATKTDLYTNTFGDPKNRAIVYVHGGPGSNCFDFEQTAAPALAAKGFFVIAYDQRGSGRSPKGSASDYSYQASTTDLDGVIASFGVTAPVLLGHSYGGSIALHYLDRFPGKAKGAIFVASPMNFPDTYNTILTRVVTRYHKEARFGAASDAEDLVEKMFPNGLTPPYTFSAADIGTTMDTWADAKLGMTMLPTKDDLAFAAKIALGSDADRALLAVNRDVGNGFEANDHVGYQNYMDLLGQHKTEVFGIYAPDQDLMFSDAQMADLQANMVKLTIIDGASHFLYVDQTDAFVDAVTSDLTSLQ